MLDIHQKYDPFYLCGIFRTTAVFRLKQLCLSLIAVFLIMAAIPARPAEIKTAGESAFEGYPAYHALVVGVGSYVHWEKRTNGVKDARDISWELRRLGVSVELLIDPTAQQLRQAWQRFTGTTGKEKKQGLIFYYSGHSQALYEENPQEIAWLIPKDAPHPKEDRRGCLQRSISGGEIISGCRQINAQYLLFLLDTPLFSPNDFKAQTPTLKLVTDKGITPARQFITSADKSEAAAHKRDFKYFLLKGLRGEADLINDGLLSGSELGLYLVDRLTKVSGEQQSPRFGYLPGRAVSTGDFILKLTDRPHQMARLFVKAHPVGAKIQIVNIIPKFKQGIELPPGEYHLHLSAPDHRIVERRIRLAAGEDRDVTIDLPREEKEFTNSIGMHFVRISAGEFIMGSPYEEPGRSSDEALHRVGMPRSFFMQDAEVSVGQFEAFAADSGYVTDAEASGGCWITGSGNRWIQQKQTNWKTPGSGSLNKKFPVRCVSWKDADSFARWLSKKEGREYRLPTEAQWEYAARAGSTTAFFTGKCLPPTAANYGRPGAVHQECSRSQNKKAPAPVAVGTLTPNPWKLYNMLGNLSEWCSDWYAPYSRDPAVAPKGPPSGNERIMRGGHWQSDLAGCRTANRRRFPPNISSDVVGFRLVHIPAAK